MSELFHLAGWFCQFDAHFSRIANKSENLPSSKNMGKSLKARHFAIGRGAHFLYRYCTKESALELLE